ncbi:transposase [Streptomyces sp. BA2]|nr:transposase [Streptomyces sp. BA2]
MTDTAWERIKDLLPRQPARGGRLHSHRTVIEAVAWKYRTGADDDPHGPPCALVSGGPWTTLSSGMGHTTWTAVPNGDGVTLQLAGHDLWIEAEDPLTNPPQFLIAAAGRAGTSCGTCLLDRAAGGRRTVTRAARAGPA